MPSVTRELEMVSGSDVTKVAVSRAHERVQVLVNISKYRLVRDIYNY